VLEPRRAGFGEVEEAGEELVETLRLFLNNIEAVFDVFAGRGAAAEDAGGSGDAGKRIADLVREACGEAPGSGEALGLLHAFDIFAELAVDVFKLLAGQFELAAVVALTVGEIAGDEGRHNKDAEFQDLIFSVHGPSHPLMSDDRTVDHGPNPGRCEGSPQAKKHAGNHERQKIEMVKNIVGGDLRTGAQPRQGSRAGKRTRR
jgi:hypothetical protein